MTELEKAAHAYATQLCGPIKLKQAPIINEHVPAFMEDAFLAGARYQSERDAKVCEEFNQRCIESAEKGHKYMSIVLGEASGAKLCSLAIRASVEGEKA